MAKDENGNRIPSFPYVKFKIVKRRKRADNDPQSDESYTEFVETHYLNVASCHGNDETLRQMKRRGIKFVGAGNLELMPKENRREVEQFIRGETEEAHPLLREPSVMDQKVSKAQKDRANA